MASVVATPITTLPETGFIRVGQLSGGIVPVSRATSWRWVKSGRFPAPVRLSMGVTAWRAEDVRKWIESQSVAHAA